MSMPAVHLSASTLLVLVTILIAFLSMVVAVRRTRRRRARLRAFANDHQYSDYLMRSFEKSEGWGRETVQIYMEYVGKMTRRRAYGFGLAHWKVYRLNRATAARQDVRSVRSGWFHTIMHFIPRQIRSPWFDHLLEDRERMAAEGRSRRFIAAATAVQCLSLVLHLLWERLWDLLTPFKTRPH
jgi:hypothetical protein